MPIDYGTNDVSTSGNFVAASGNFTTLTVNNTPVATGVGVTITNAADNRVLTSDGTSTGINAESNLTFNGTTLDVTGIIDIDNLRLDGNTLSATNTDGNIIVQSNGTGALQRDSGGNTRGQYSVDLQNVRSSSTMVAAGNYSVVGGGIGNTASNSNSTVGGGLYNTASGSYSTVSGGVFNAASDTRSTVGGGSNNNASSSYSTVGGGFSNNASGSISTVGGGNSNTASNTYSTVGGGRTNTASGYISTVGGGSTNTASNTYSTVGGGNSNTASNYASTVGGGRGNTASGNRSTVGGGSLNTASGSYSIVSGGAEAIASLYGEEARSSGKFHSQGDAQARRFVLRNTTTTSLLQTLYLDGISQSITVPDNSTWHYTVKIVARNTTNVESAGYTIDGIVERNSLSTILLAENKNVLYTDNLAWDTDINIENGEFHINVTGDDESTIYWVAYVEVIQVVIPIDVPSYS